MAVSVHDATPSTSGNSYTASVDATRLRRENAELRRANEILKAASASFAGELYGRRSGSTRPS